MSHLCSSISAGDQSAFQSSAALARVWCMPTPWASWVTSSRAWTSTDAKPAALAASRASFYEPGLTELPAETLAAGVGTAEHLASAFEGSRTTPAWNPEVLGEGLGVRDTSHPHQRTVRSRPTRTRLPWSLDALELALYPRIFR